MKRKPTFLFVLSLAAPALFFTGCPGHPGGLAADYPKKLIPMIEGAGSTLPLYNQNDTESESYLQSPKIALRFDEKLVQVLTTNLDADDANEQVIVVKGAGPDAATTSLIVADYQNAQSGYIRSWETSLGTLAEKTIRVAVKDMIGKHTFQIIASGTNDANQVSLKVFKIVSPAGAPLVYAPIFQQESEVSAEVEESDRGAGYGEGFSFGASFPIVVFRSDPAATDISSIMRDTYEYEYGSQAYVLRRHENIKVEKAATEQLAGLLQNSSPDLLKKYIDGIWYKADAGDPSAEKILTVNQAAGEIAFYAQGAQEVYNWKYSRRSLFNTLLIYTESALLKSVQPNITIVLNSLNDINLEINEFSTMEQWLNEEWGGRYVRRAQSDAAAHNQAPDDPARLVASFLQGDYNSLTGVKLSFAYPAFTWREGTTVKKGGFSIMELREQDTAQFVLSLKIVADQGLNVTDEFYALELKTKPAAGAPVASFTIKPVQTTVYGLQNLRGQPLTFTRQGR